MRKLIIAAALTAAAAFTAPAQAQWNEFLRYEYGAQYGHSIDEQIRQTRRDISRASDNDRITEWQESRLLRRLDDVIRLYNRYRWNGLTAYERQDLVQRLRMLRREIWGDNRWRDGRQYRDTDRGWSDRDNAYNNDWDDREDYNDDE